MPEIKRVYILGAGFNQCVKDWDGLKPPLANNFFQSILRSKKYPAEPYLRKLDHICKYIEKYWKKTKEDLLNEPFNIEDCFTLLELQFRKAEENCDEKWKEYYLINLSYLTTLFANFLSEFNVVPEWTRTFFRTNGAIPLVTINQEPIYNFASKIYNEKQTVITFNYDCILENAIEHVSGLNPQNYCSDKEFYEGQIKGNIPDKYLAYSHCNWNLPLAYGFRFDEVTLQIAGVSARVSGNRFYAHIDNKLYNSRILKLHGSVNWFEYLNPTIFNAEQFQHVFPRHKQGDISLMRYPPEFLTIPMQDIWHVYPLIITPVLYKDIYYNRRPFPELWDQARKYLTECNSLVVIGYSFAPLDWSTRQLMLEAFENNQLQELIIVNPDTSVVKIVKELTHFTKPILVCHNLEEFLRI